MKKVYAVLKTEIVESTIFIEIEEGNDILLLSADPTVFRTVGEMPNHTTVTKYKVQFQLEDRDVTARELEGTIKR